MSTRAKKSSGNPAAKKQSPDDLKLAKALKSVVELVGSMGPDLHPELEVTLRASAAGLMFVYAGRMGLPNPAEVVSGKASYTKDEERTLTI